MSKQLREYVYKNPTAESCLGWDEIPTSLKLTLDTLKTKKIRSKKIRQLTRLLPGESYRRGLLPSDFLMTYKNTDWWHLNIQKAGNIVATFTIVQSLLFIANAVVMFVIFRIPKIPENGNSLIFLSLGGLILLGISFGLRGILIFRASAECVRNFQWELGQFFKYFPTLSKRFFRCGEVGELRLLVENHLVRIATEILESELAHPLGSPKTTQLRWRFNQKHYAANALSLARPKKFYFMVAEEQVNPYQSFDPSI